jgi:hypothetical protein
MVKKLSISAAVVLLLCSASLADIGQVQAFSIGSMNIVARRGPVGSAQAENIVTVEQSQRAQKPRFNKITAKQQENAILVQRGTAKGAGGASSVTQQANIAAVQAQTKESFGPTEQRQRLKVNLDQITAKSGGVGNTEGIQTFVGGQSHAISTPRMTAGESQQVGIVQYAVVSGRRGSENTAVNTVDVQLSQGQIVAGGPSAKR